MAKKFFTSESLSAFVDKIKSYVDNAVSNKVSKTVEYYGDINSLVTSGFYRVGTNTNLPSGYEYGQIIVSRGSDTATQICCSYSTGKIITRSCSSPDSNPKWTAWNEYITKEDNGLKLHTEKSGTTGTITLPSTFKELHILIGTTNYMYTFNILADYLTSTATLFRNGYALSTSVYGDVYISVSKTAITAWTARKENVVQEVSVKVYYK